jgi:protocatechuate 3,4-dioxygenase beta subunit
MIKKCKKIHNLFFLVTAIPLTLILLFFSSATAKAQTGSIHGQVTEVTEGTAAGPGIVDFWVDAYDLDGNWIAEAQTDSDGLYTIVDLVPGAYKIFFYGLKTIYIGEWYDDQADFADAEPVQVVSGTQTNLDPAALTVGGKISGIINDSNGDPVADVLVEVYDANYKWIGYSSAPTGADGTYTVTGLALGTGHIVYFDTFHTRCLSGWYQNGSADPADATPVDVPDRSEVKLSPVELTIGGKISGTIKDNSSNGISDIWVEVYDSATEDWLGYSIQKTGNDGTYTVTGLPAGDHFVYFYAHDTNYVSEWYDNRNITNPDTVSVVLGGEHENVDAELALGGSISGTVTDENSAPVQGAIVDVYDINQNWIGSAETDGAGMYTVTGLPETTAGNGHKLQFFEYWDAVLQEWYDDKPNFAAADLVQVSAGVNTPNIDVMLVPKKPPVLTPIYLLLLLK